MKISDIKTRVDLLIDYLNLLPNDEVFKASELEEKLGFPIRGSQAIRTFQYTKLKEYCEKVFYGDKDIWFYGNPKAIQVLREKKNEN